MNRSHRTYLSPGIKCVVLVLGASLCIQLSVGMVKPLFDTVGSVGVSGLRMAIAASVLLALTKPVLSGRLPREWAGIVTFGVAMAAMNVCFYKAVAHLPLGLAVTLEFLGPFFVAFLGTRIRWELLLPLAALAGVALMSNASGRVTVVGVAWGLGAAVAFGAYTAGAGLVGRASGGHSGLALSVTASAVLLAPFSVAAAPRVPGVGGWASIVGSGIVGVAIAFSFTFRATRLTSSRVVATLFAVDPAMGYLIGAVLLNESLNAAAVLGIALVVVSGALVTWRSGAQAKQMPPEDRPLLPLGSFSTSTPES